MNLKKALFSIMLISRFFVAQGYWPPSLQNCGNTCFANASIQCLYNVRPLTNALTEGQNPFKLETAPTPYHYVELISQFEKTKDESTPHFYGCSTTLGKLDSACYKLMHAPVGAQQDATELMRAFLDDLIEKSSHDLKANIKSLFRFKPVSELICPAIPDKDLREYRPRPTPEELHDDQGNPITPIQLEIPITTMQGQPLRTLDECLANYFAIEQVEYTPPGEAIPRLCSKQFKLENSPKIFLINLKRFKNEPGQPTEKRDHTVIIPTTLDLSQYIVNSKSNHKFDLIGVVIHSGNIGGGHYWAYVKNNNQWYNCNDRSITKVSIVDPTVIQEINGQPGGATGYILCYQKQLTAAEKKLREAEEQRRAAERARRKSEEERIAREKAAAESLRKQQEMQRAAEEERKADELKKLSDQLDTLQRQLKGLTQSLG